MSVLLKNPGFDGLGPKELAQQIEAKKKCRDKLPLWFSTPKIYYPKRLNIEQTSSEITATYKSEKITGKHLADLTGGFGVDSFFFSKKINQVFHCEIDATLSEIAEYNFKVLGATNVVSINEDGMEFLKTSSIKFDWVFLDPSRRHENKGKVFQLSDCLPNILDNLELLFDKVDHILIKTSPLLDISLGIGELRNVEEVHVVAVQNEVKELLWFLKKGFNGKVRINTINFNNSNNEVFNFWYLDEKEAVSSYGFPEQYLYEPNAAILKSGAFRTIGNQFDLKKLHEHSHLYTSKELLDFPGRRFRIEAVVLYNKKSIQKLKLYKANVTTRNFPESVASIRKKFKIKDGGDVFLFFTKDVDGRLIMIQCSKV